ncbi:MAG: hypothetical protein IPP94_06590 [Ignavibacteria bacterium]|nr:hypothetical protein [Ignavibacteria bacterium]
MHADSAVRFSRVRRRSIASVLRCGAFLFLVSSRLLPAIPVGGSLPGSPPPGGTLGFATPHVTVLDHRSGQTGSIALTQFEGDSLLALQFRVVNRAGHLRFEGASPGDSLAASGTWHFSYAIRRGALQPDLGATDTLTIVLFALNGAALPAGSYQDLVRFTYAVSDIAAATASTTLSIEDVAGSLPGGADAFLGAGPPQEVTIMNTVQKGDVDGNDHVDINDLLGVIHVILGKEVLQGASAARADIAPWPDGDNAINVRDLVLTQRVILDGAYPDGTPLSAAPDEERRGASFRASTPGAVPDVKIVVYVHAGGMAVHMTNLVRVKGIQLELNNVAAVPDTMRLRTIFDPGPTWNRTASNVLVLLMNNDAAAPIEPGARFVTIMTFPVANPFQINLKKLVVADMQNSRITNLEASIVYGVPSGIGDVPLPTVAELRSVYPNPAVTSTTLEFAMLRRSAVSITVHSGSGAVVRRLAAEEFDAGSHRVAWDGRGDAGEALPTGMYWFSVSGTSGRLTRPVALLR